MGKSIWDTISDVISAPAHYLGEGQQALGGALKGLPGGNIYNTALNSAGEVTQSVGDAASGNLGHFWNNASNGVEDAVQSVEKFPVVGPYILPTVAGIYGGPLGYGAATGIQNGINASRNGANFGQAASFGAKTGAISAAGSYAGNALGSAAGSALSNNGLSAAGNTLSETPAQGLGNTFGGQAVGSVAPIGSTLGNFLGSTNIGGFAGQGLANIATQSSANQGLAALGPQPAGPPGWMPSRQPSMGLPQSLSQFSSLNPQQQESNIATRGVYGQGNGPQESQYFTNLVNRQLVDDSGKVAGDTSSINPVESQYLNQLGLGGYSNPTDLLKNINGFAG